MLWELLFCGKEIPYTVGSSAIETAEMFGFTKRQKGTVVVANRIFETVLYNLFLTSVDAQQDQIYKAALQNKNQFVENDNKLFGL